MVALFFLFTLTLLVCGLVNSYFFFFPPSKLLHCLLSLLKPTKNQIETNKKKSCSRPITPKSESTTPSELETIFSTFDSDGDGFITGDELEESLRRLRLYTTRGEVNSLMGRVDTNGDGLIDLDEFRQLYESFEDGRMKSEEREEEEEKEEEFKDLKEAFEVFDGNRDGVITVEELGSVLRSMGLKCGAKVDEECEEMIRMVDLDGDGRVDFEEFKKMMLVKGGKLF